MRVQVLHIDDCPNWQQAGSRVRQALDRAGFADVEVEYVLIASPDEAVRAGFAGSPTIVGDGNDLFPSEGRTADLACRVYRTEDGLAGTPTVQQIEKALVDRYGSERS
jgi:hypothetical protein